MTRREWLLVLASVAAGPLDRARGRTASLAGAALQPAESRLQTWVERHVPRDALRDLARAYLDRNPGERVEAMTAALLAGWRSGTPLEAHVADLVRRDFDADRIEDLDGWLVTRTEARLLALATA